MKWYRRLRFILIIQAVCAVLATILTIVVLNTHDLLTVDGKFNASDYFHWSFFWYVTFMLLSNIIMSHRFAEGRIQEITFFLSSSLVITELFSYILYSLIKCRFNFSYIDWFGTLNSIMRVDGTYYGIVAIIFVLFIVLYSTVIDRKILYFIRGGIHGQGKLKQLNDSNLENSRWMNENEKKKIFKTYKYSQLAEVKKDGIPVMGKLTYKSRDMDVAFNSPCHSIIIGSTGSGKTTTFVSPMIQLLAATSAGSSMVITDPKGELFSLHSKYLASRGYDVKVVDLRDTYASYRWNPLDSIWDMYENHNNAHKMAFRHRNRVNSTQFKLMDPIESFENAECWYEFEGCAFADYQHLIASVKLYKKKIFDEVYEDLNDLVSVLIPIENEKDPMWEKGARSITLAVLLAMLEDSANPDLGMTKEKFTFFNLAKILQNSSNDYIDLRNYFRGRSPLSKALALSKQVCDAATQTRASYMSIVYEKLTLFNDAGICALTSSSDFTAGGLAERPTALFLKIPDEKDTRHNLAAIFILNIYKTLIKVASATEELTLPRNVYFIMDEFGNMPKIEKFDKFITVGRSRKIWFNMIVQSYAQLNNVYGDTVADIVKGNCGIKMFIGSNDMGTCKEYSELCGNITVVTTSTSGSVHSTDVNISAQTQVRPLIYPSELQRLNHPGDIGHSIIVTFGNYPLKTYFSPSFNVPFYQIGKMDQSDIQDRFFDENEAFYDIKVRNGKVLKSADNTAKSQSANQNVKEQKYALGSIFGQSNASVNQVENVDTAADENKMTDEEATLLVAFREWKASHPKEDPTVIYEFMKKGNVGNTQKASDGVGANAETPNAKQTSNDVSEKPTDNSTASEESKEEGGDTDETQNA